MFVPLHDGVPLRFMRTPYVTYALICACIGIQLTLSLWPGAAGDLAIMAGFGMIPSVLFGTAQLPEGLAQLPAWLTLFSNVLLHARARASYRQHDLPLGLRRQCRGRDGPSALPAVLLLCGIVGGMTHALMYPDSEQPLIGASGAVAGVIAAYLMLHPNVRIWCLGFICIPLRVPAMYALVVWILLQIVAACFDPQGNVGWWAHLAGSSPARC